MAAVDIADISAPSSKWLPARVKVVVQAVAQIKEAEAGTDGPFCGNFESQLGEESNQSLACRLARSIGEFDVQLNAPSRFAFLPPFVAQDRSVMADESVACWRDASVESEARGGYPLEKMAVGAYGMIDVGERRIAPGWEFTSEDATVRQWRDVGDSTDFHIHITSHVDAVKAHERRTEVYAVIVGPRPDFLHQSVASRQHAAKRRDDADADRRGARPIDDMRWFDELHYPAPIERSLLPAQHTCRRAEIITDAHGGMAAKVIRNPGDRFG